MKVAPILPRALVAGVVVAAICLPSANASAGSGPSTDEINRVARTSQEANAALNNVPAPASAAELKPYLATVKPLLERVRSTYESWARLVRKKAKSEGEDFRRSKVGKLLLRYVRASGAWIKTQEQLFRAVEPCGELDDPDAQFGCFATGAADYTPAYQAASTRLSNALKKLQQAINEQ